MVTWEHLKRVQDEFIEETKHRLVEQGGVSPLVVLFTEKKHIGDDLFVKVKPVPEGRPHELMVGFPSMQPPKDLAETLAPLLEGSERICFYQSIKAAFHTYKKQEGYREAIDIYRALNRISPEELEELIITRLAKRTKAYAVLKVGRAFRKSVENEAELAKLYAQRKSEKKLKLDGAQDCLLSTLRTGTLQRVISIPLDETEDEYCFADPDIYERPGEYGDLTSDQALSITTV